MASFNRSFRHTIGADQAGGDGSAASLYISDSSLPIWHFLYFFPEPHQQGSFRPNLGRLRRKVTTGPASSASGGASAPAVCPPSMALTAA